MVVIHPLLVEMVESERSYTITCNNFKLLTTIIPWHSINIVIGGKRFSSYGIYIVAKALSPKLGQTTLIKIKCLYEINLRIPCNGIEHYYQVSEEDYCKNVTDTSIVDFGSEISYTDNLPESLLDYDVPRTISWSISSFSIILILIRVILVCRKWMVLSS